MFKNNQMKKKKQLVAAAAVLLLAGGYYWYDQSGSTEKKVRYATAEAEKGALASSISASGNVIVDNQSTVDPTITGTVADLSVKVGDKVEKGQFLFNIVNNDLSVSVSKAAASYESAKNSLESAKIDKDSAKAAYEKAKDEDDDDDDAYTGRELDVLKDKVDLAESKIIQAEKSLAASGADFGNARTDAAERKVVSAISGTVLGVNVKNGDDLSRTSSVDNASAPIIIGEIETLKAEVEVNEVDIAKVAIGQKVTIEMDALDGVNFFGKVEKIDSLGTVSQGVVSYNVTVGFDSLDARIKPDMTVSASIITDEKQDVLKVPSSAVKTENNAFYVEILVKGSPQKRDAAVGISNGAETEITSGLAAGDKVITETIDVSGEESSSSGSSARNSGGNVRIPGVGGFGR
ncbi:MAG: hypothetical protein QG620_81 [Patescibacteria group bacterium]|nr:hypothetical protein [Patescibacteria group bacterium]